MAILVPYIDPRPQYKPMPKPRIAILASGGGTTTESFINLTLEGKVKAEVVLVISNKSNAGVFDKVNRINREKNIDIKTMHIGRSNYPGGKNEIIGMGEQTKAEEEAILKQLNENEIDLVLLLGYMKRVGSSIVQKYGWNSSLKSVFESSMLNTHPGLLPETKGLFGLRVQEKVLSSGYSHAGHCIFAVDDEYDDGPVITEHKVDILPEDTPKSLFERVQRSEKLHLADDVNYFIRKKYGG